jgi:hypothetical protein
MGNRNEGHLRFTQLKKTEKEAEAKKPPVSDMIYIPGNG